ncbi:unnamed protein product [Diatraea saccharalis]|uniref:P-type domain-containing protein n=1 Tax=Diatraea saccharalis TaxID=40085 RepID=A0A9N9R7L0_9NEOP|nr:unnamed protein product [Diatraea saccharalis]
MIPYANAGNFKEEDEEKLPYDYEITKEVKWYDKVLLNRPSKVTLIAILLTILAPVLMYKYFFASSKDWPPSDGLSFGSCLVQREARLPCGIGSISQSDCHKQCCYDLATNFCFHRFPSRFSYVMDQAWHEDVVLRPRFSTVPFASQNSVKSLRLSIDEISPTHLSLTFYDSKEVSLQGRRIEYKEYDYRISSHELNVIVERINDSTIFNTDRGPLIASENIWEITFKLTNGLMFGLGDLPLREGTTKIIYNHDGGLSSLPLIYAQSNGSYHGLLIDVIKPTEVHVTENNQIIVRSIAKSGLKLHLFLGPEPKDILRDVMDLLGNKMQLEYWMLGAHVCSETTEDQDEAVNYLKSFITDATAINFPYESHCGTRPIVFNADNVTEDLTAVVAGIELLKIANKKFVPHISPYIRYPDILEDNNFEDNNDTDVISTTTVKSMDCLDIVCEFEHFMLQWNSTHVYKGSINSIDEPVVYPDYEVVNEEFMAKLWALNVDADVDGVVLVNNWPLDESFKLYEDISSALPYFNKNFGIAFNNTPQWNITKPGTDQRYFEEHNIYGSNFIRAMAKNITKDAPTWSSSQWMNTNVIINRQNVQTSWTNLQNELVETALGGISGHWLWSSPVCGDTANFNIDNQANLCVKWYMAATFFPTVKIHSKSTPRDPLAFEGTHRHLIIDALNKRLSLSPYFFTVLQEGPLLRPMFYQFPHNEELIELRSQFSVGDSLLIAPNLQPIQSHVHVRVPPGIWYEFWSGLKIDADEGEVVTMTTTEADFLTFIRGGAIIIMQTDVRATAEATRKNSPYTLVIASETTNVTKEEINEVRVAEGKLYISQNMTIHFRVNNTDLIINTDDSDFSSLCSDEALWAKIINKIKIYGLGEEENNFDHHKQLTTEIDLCDLENGDINFTLSS